MSVQYTEGRGVQYTGGCSVHQRDIMRKLGGGDIMSILGGYHEYTGRYQD